MFDRKGKEKEVVENDLNVEVCPECQFPIPTQDLHKHIFTCPNCNHHFKISAYDRLDCLLDDKSFKEIYSRANSKGINDFPEYNLKLARYQKDSGLSEAVITGFGKIDDQRVAVAVMDSSFMMGSMGQVVGEKITRLIELATRKKYPLVIFSASGGARMQEGIMSLFQMAKTSAVLEKFNQKGGLYIVVLTHPTTGGVSASFAMLGDIILAEPKALVGFAGRRVIEKTISEQLPESFQKAEFVLEKGFVDAIVDRKDQKRILSKLIKMHTKGAN
jgi:acetyl-CoA carboxylase carboxyl transferase subunit beta